MFTHLFILFLDKPIDFFQLSSNNINVGKFRKENKMKVIEINHDRKIVHESLPAMARAIIEDLGPEGVLTDYFTTDEALEKFLNSFERQSEAEQISLLKVFAQDINFKIVK